MMEEIEDQLDEDLRSDQKSKLLALLNEYRKIFAPN